MPPLKLEAVADEIKSLSSDLTKRLEEQDSQIAEHGETSRKTADAVTSLTEQLIELKAVAEKLESASEDVAAAKAAAEEQQKRLDELEAKLQRPDLDIDGGLMDPGSVFVKSEAYADMVKVGDKVSRPVKVKTLFPEVEVWGIGRTEQKTAALSSNQATRLVVPTRGMFIPQLLRDLRMRDLIPVRPTGSNLIEYIRQTGFHDEVTVSVTGIARTGSVATATVASTSGYVTGMPVKIAGADQAEYNGVHHIKVASSTTFTFNVTGTPATPATGTITAQVMRKFGAAAETAEGGSKPEATIETELRSQAVRTIAHWTGASRQMLADSGQMAALINDQLRFGVLYKEDSQILYGTGTDPQIQGILNEIDVQEYLWSSGVTGDTQIDAIRKAMTWSQQNEHVPTGVVVNPLEWQEIELAKGSDGHYIWVSINVGGQRLFFMQPVVVTNAILQGTGLVGAFASGATLWDREDVTVRVSDSHSDYFIKNQQVVLAEERMALTINRPDAFVKVTFDAAP